MGESLDIDSPFWGRAMPRSYSADLRERVIDAVERDGASRREAAERFNVSVTRLATRRRLGRALRDRNRRRRLPDAASDLCGKARSG